MTIQDKAERIIEYGLEYSNDRIALIGTRYRPLMLIFGEIERILSDGEFKVKTKIRGERLEILEPFNLRGFIIGQAEEFTMFRGFRFQGIFVDDLKELTEKQINQTLIPSLAITFNPAIEIPENPRQPTLVDLSKSPERIEFNPLDHEQTK